MFIKGKKKLSGFPLHAKQTQRGGRVIALLILDLDARRGGWSAPNSSSFTPGKETRWLGLGAGLDRSDKSRPRRGSNPGAASLY